MNLLSKFILTLFVSLISFTSIAQEQDEPIEKIVYPEEIGADGPFAIVEDMPTFTGGLAGFYKYMSENMKYPKQAKKKGIQGKVFVKFMVGKDGEISNVQLLKGIGAGCDQEALNTIKKSPRWIAGRQKGKPVKVWMTIPIVFNLPKANKKTKGIWTD